MVDITKISKGTGKTILYVCRIDEKYKKQLDKLNISFTSFVEQALKETFPNL